MATPISVGEFARLVGSLSDPPKGDGLKVLLLLCAGQNPEKVRAAFREVSTTHVPFHTWLDYYRSVEPYAKRLFQTGKAPPKGPINKQLVMAIAAVDMIGQECRKNPSPSKAQLAAVQKGAKNVFGWVRDLPPDFQIGAVKGTLSMKMIQDYRLTKVRPVLETYLNIRRALKDPNEDDDTDMAAE
jgi:hypothetical protein